MLIPRQKVPALTLDTLDHGTFDVHDDGSERGTVVCFYRGLHCPLCANYLKELEKQTPAFAERGVKTIAISSDGEERTRAMAEKVGAGTLRTPKDVVDAHKAGARFGVSPGLSTRVLDAAEEVGLPMLPGVATPSEAMAAADRGLSVLKFFPAEANGGAPVLKAWASPLKGLVFCPTGGVSKANAGDYLGLENVVCVGGSWVAPGKLLAAGDWAGITALAIS